MLREDHILCYIMIRLQSLVLTRTSITSITEIFNSQREKRFDKRLEHNWKCCLLILNAFLSSFQVTELSINLLTARLNIKMLVVFLIFLFNITTRTTRRLPTKPTMMMSVKIMGTTMGTTAIRISRCFSSTSLMLARTLWLVIVSFMINCFCQNLQLDHSYFQMNL